MGNNGYWVSGNSFHGVGQGITLRLQSLEDNILLSNAAALCTLR
jgi:hypothetical protein